MYIDRHLARPPVQGVRKPLCLGTTTACFCMHAVPAGTTFAVHGLVVIADTCKSSSVAVGVSQQMVQRLQQCVVVVDPVSTGGMLAAELLQRNYCVMALWTSEVQEPLGRAWQRFRPSFSLFQ